MGDAGLGVVLGLGIDSSGANAGLKQFEGDLSSAGQTGKVSLDKVVEATEPLEKSLLNQHQTVHLLAEEMGVHLPRTVVSGIAEMLPQVASLGTALLGVFAVEKVWDWVKESQEALHATYMEAHQDISDLDRVASEAFKHAGAEAAEMLTHFKTSLAGTFGIAEIDARMSQLQRYHAAFKEIDEEGNRMTRERAAELGAVMLPALNEGIKSLGDVDKKISETGQLQFDAHKRLAEVTVKESHEACEQVKHDQEELARDARATVEEWNREQEALKRKFLTFGPTLQQLVVQIDGVTKATDGTVESLTAWELGQEHALAILPLVKQNFEGLIQPVRQVNYVLHEDESALKAVAKAMQSDTAAQGEQLAARLAGLVAGRRAQAGVEAVWEVARGIACLAEGAWPPNPAAIIAGGLHFEAAAQYGILAGKSTHRGSASGSGTSGSRPGVGQSGFGGSGSGAPPQTLAPGAAGAGSRYGGTLHVMIMGESAAGEWLAGTLNAAVGRGVNLTATSSQRGAPVGH